MDVSTPFKKHSDITQKDANATLNKNISAVKTKFNEDGEKIIDIRTEEQK